MLMMESSQTSTLSFETESILSSSQNETPLYHQSHRNVPFVKRDLALEMSIIAICIMLAFIIHLVFANREKLLKNLKEMKIGDSTSSSISDITDN